MTTVPSGSYMQLSDIKSYSWKSGIEIEINLEDCILVDNYNYVPTSIIEPQLTEQQFRTMETIVPTWFNYTSISILSK